MTRQAAEIVLLRWLARSPYSQSDLAEIMGVCRFAVSKWCHGVASPSVKNAVILEDVTSGAVPAAIWPRRTIKSGTTPGAQAIWAAARERGIPIFALANQCAIPHRSLYRWAAGESNPQKSSIREINKRLGLSLSVADFEVRA